MLVVDDEAEMLELISILLEGADLTLLSARDGREALSIIREERPDLVLTDVMMPRLDGCELCKLIKSDPSTRGTTVVLMSAANRLESCGCEADEVIAKPFDTREITRTVSRLLVA